MNNMQVVDISRTTATYIKCKPIYSPSSHRLIVHMYCILIL
uniref:Uncharacterized protein n=1 Tax=Anguilla anguilla TaxID=7936 RepID=A0A0E9PMH7_ANGAN